MLRVLKMNSPSGQRYGEAMTKYLHSMMRRVRNLGDTGDGLQHEFEKLG